MRRVFDFVANTTDGVYAVDRTQTIVLWNAAATEIFGYDAAEVVGRRCFTVLRGRDGEGCAVCQKECEAIVAAREMKFPRRRDVRTATKSGRAIWIDVSSLVVPSRNAHLTVLVHLFREVTERHRSLRVLHELADIVGEYVHDGSEPARPASSAPESPVELTRRERDVLRLLAAGARTEVIAERLCISPRTARNHVANILAKLGVHSRVEAVAYSIRNGVV